MTAIPFTVVCTMLGIDAKTLRQWLKTSSLPVHTHPTDARIKCLTLEQVQQLAILHHRCIKEETLPLNLGSAQPMGEQLASQVAIPVASASQLPATCRSDADLMQALSSLEASVTNLQQQVAGLALELLQERTSRYEHRLQALEALIRPPRQQDRSLSPPQTTSKQKSQRDVPLKDRRIHPARGRPRAILPLIEYGANGTYVVICPQQGELALTPDSPEWFAWLETLSSLRFLGKLGRLSAYRNRGRSSWIAYRRIHSHRHDHTLGNTSDLTIDCLEHMAAQLQSYLPSL